MIDLTTLAAAKAYTDKKCGGAGSGGGLPVVEIDEATLGAIVEDTNPILPDNVGAQLSIALANRLPVVVILPIMSGIATLTDMQYILQMGGASLVLTKGVHGDTEWVANVNVEDVDA